MRILWTNKKPPIVAENSIMRESLVIRGGRRNGLKTKERVQRGGLHLSGLPRSQRQDQRRTVKGKETQRLSE